MKSIIFYSILYGILILLLGLMNIEVGNIGSMIIEIICGISIFILCYFAIKKVNIAYYLIGCFVLILLIFYGYLFSLNHNFYHGLFAAISFFLLVGICIEIYKMNSLKNKKP